MISPTILALVLILLGMPSGGRKKPVYFLIGAVTAASLVVGFGYYFGYRPMENFEQSNGVAIFKIILGLILLVIAFRELFHKQKKDKKKREHQNKPPKFLVWAGIGFFMNITNINSIILRFMAAKKVGEAHDLALAFAVPLLLINVIVFTLPVSVPLLITVIVPSIANRVLGKLDELAKKYSHYLVFGVFLLLGGLILWQGIKSLFNLE